MLSSREVVSGPAQYDPIGVIKDDPPGSVWQNRGINEDNGYPGR